MPLRDHFHPPVSDRASWEEVHGAWPSSIAYRLNAILPPRYRSGVNIHLGNVMEVDIGAYDQEIGGHENGNHSDTAPAWEPAASTLLLDTDELTPPEYEVRVYDQRRAQRLVAVVEIVSPGNKDREKNRVAFVSKCLALLHHQVCVAIVDPVTERSSNLYAELAERMEAPRPSAPSRLNFRVEPLQFDPCFVDRELPIDGSLLLVDAG